MRLAGVQLFIGCVLLCGTFTPAATALPAAPSPSPVGSALVVPAAQLLDGDEQLVAAVQAHRASPQAVQTRLASQTEFRNLTALQAVAVANRAFPSLINEFEGAPRLAPGEEIRGYSSDHSAEIALPKNKHAVLETLEPIALETAPRQFKGLDLHLQATSASYTPERALVSPLIPKHLDQGFTLPNIGLSLTPVESDGHALSGGSGEPFGASIIYHETSPATDTLAKATPRGFSADTLLRSTDSPHTLYFKLAMPAGAYLSWEPGDSGLRVLANGTPLATIPRPTAIDAEGTAVPLSVTMLPDNIMQLSLPADLAPYDLPIAVDPTVEDWIFEVKQPKSESPLPEWHFVDNGGNFAASNYPEKEIWLETISPYHTASEYGGLFYTTQGASQIVRTEVTGYWDDPLELKIQDYLELETAKGIEDYNPLPPIVEQSEQKFVSACEPALDCTNTHAGTAPPENGNTAVYLQEASAAGTKKGSEGVNRLFDALVLISQTAGPEVSFNTTSETIHNPTTGETVPNVLYGSGSWLSPAHGAFEVHGKDPGTGLSWFTVGYPGGWSDTKEYKADGDCKGLQCPEDINEGSATPGSIGYTYEGKMPDGVNTLWSEARDSALLSSPQARATLKVDGTPPGHLKVTGLVAGSSLPMGEAHLKVEATDGEGTTPSSGVKSITVLVDGKEVAGSGGSCPEGPCSAAKEITLVSRQMKTGEHTMVVTATDNADNVAQEEFIFWVKGAPPLTVGPAEIDSSTGEMKLATTDVPLGGTVDVTRSFRSRELTSGLGGPLGPQWSMTLGGGENLTLLADGSAVVDASGATTTYRRVGSKFFPPPGDSELSLASAEGEAGKGISEYILTDNATATRSRFIQPAGLQNAAPTFSRAFGEGAGLTHAQGVAVDASGNLWVTSYETDQIEKFSPSGVLLATYGSKGTALGQFEGPWGIAISPVNGDVYVSDLGNNRVVAMSPTGAFLRTFGRDVGEGTEAESCEKNCHAGESGSQLGEMTNPAGIAVGPAGTVFIVDSGNNRIEEFSEAGHVKGTYGSTGSGADQLNSPRYIALQGEYAYVTDAGNERVDEFTPGGEFVRAFGWGVSNGEAKLETCTSSCKAGIAGSGSGQFNEPIGIGIAPSSGNVYVGDFKNSRIEELSETGTYLNTFGSSGKGLGELEEAKGLAVNGSGAVYVADYALGRVSEWNRPTWYAAELGGPLAADATTYTYTTVEAEGKTIVVPAAALAPIPAGVSCTTKVEKGCRELTFEYANTTTATGEAKSDWGSYKGRLASVWFHAWEPGNPGKVLEKAVADYNYDSKGRLRAEWDPRLASPLKTTYGYDSEGHVTAESAPGQQPWIFNYGTTEGDGATGRLISVLRPSASTTISDTEAPTITTEPKMSTATPVVGEAVTVTNGSWANSPLSFTYQWETCTAQQETWTCEAIPGAVNPSYSPLSRDRHKHLQVTVSATNAAGTTQICAEKYAGVCATATAPEIGGTAELNEEPIPTPPVFETSAVWTIEYHVPASGAGAPYNLSSTETARWGQTDNPVEGAALFPPDEPMGWPAAHYTSATLKYYDKEGRSVNTALPGGGVATTEYNAANNATRELTAANREQALKEGTKSAEVSKLLDTENRYNGETKAEEATEENEVLDGKRAALEPGTEVLERKGPRHLVKLAEGGTEVQARSISRYYYDEGSPSGRHYGLVTKTTVGAEYEGREADVRTTKDRYTELGWTLRKPTSTTIDPNGLNLTNGTEYSPTTGKAIETISPGGVPPALTYAGSLGKDGLTRGELSAPNSAAIDESGNVWVTNSRDDVVEFSATGTELNAYGETGKAETKLQFNAPTGIAFNKTAGQFYVADSENNRVVVMSATGGFVKAFGAAGTGPGQMKEARGVAFDANNNVWVADHANNRLDEFSESGTFVAAVGWGVTNGESKLQTCTSSCRAGLAGSGAGQLNGPSNITFLDNDMYVTDTGNNRVEEYNSSNEFVETIGSSGTGKGQFREPTGISTVGGLLYVADSGNDRVEQFSPSGYPGETIGSDGTGSGQLSSPAGVIGRGTGQMFVVDSGDGRVEKWETGRNYYIKSSVYYTTEANATYPACGGHAEWAGLLCMNVPPQPEAPGLPSLPTSTITYNVWDEPETTVETFGASKRTKTETYDAAGRALTSETTVSPSHDTALPKVTQEYNTTTGALEKESTTTESKTKTITRVLNSLGQLVSYTDAEAATTKYAYDIDGRLEEVSDPKGSQSYVYDPTTGDLVKLVDSAAGTFTASYGPEGNLHSETYPNGMTATIGEASNGQPTKLEYVKTSHCTEKCTWFTQTLTPTIHGETAVQTTSLGTERYSYDTAGRITQTQEEAGGQCTVRLYEYDSESQRTALVTRAPGPEGKCATEGGSAQTHVYDPSGRLLDAGVTYEEFGNVTTLPTADAGKYALTDTYYVDNQLDTQTENGLTTTYHYDPLGRTEEAKTGGNNPIVYHYDGEGEGAAWSTEGSTWTRDIAGIGGSLVGVQSSSGSTVLQLRDLQGDIVATASLSEAETKLLSTYNSTEFGVPQAGTTPPKYAWQGASAVVTGVATGATNGDGSEYVPLIGTTLQTQVIARPGAFPNDNTVLPTVQGAYIAEDAGLLKQLSEQRQGEEEAAAKKHDEELLAIACEENPLACPEQESNDPGWVWHLSIEASDAIASAIFGGEFYFASQTTVADFLKQFLGIDFVHQLEEAFVKGVFGLNREQVEAWGFDLAEGLSLCVFDSYGYKTATCWVYVTTEEKFFGWKNSPLGAIGIKYEQPRFGVAPEIAFCPYGESNCYGV